MTGLRTAACAVLVALLSSATLGSAVLAEEAVDAPGAELRGLDKMASTTSELPVHNGQTQRFGELTISVSACRFPKDNPSADAWAHLTINDQTGATLFSGWMSAASPALSALDHPRYDVWLIRCISS